LKKSPQQQEEEEDDDGQRHGTSDPHPKIRYNFTRLWWKTFGPLWDTADVFTR